MAQHLRVPAAFAEDPGSVPSTSMAAHTSQLEKKEKEQASLEKGTLA